VTRQDVEELRARMRACFRFDGVYTLASGRTSKYYYDGKLGTLDPSFAWILGNLLVDVIHDSGAEAVGGLEIGSVPIAQSVGIAAHLRGISLPTFIVRKEAKEHGTRSQIAQAYVPDGPLLKPGRRVAIVDDVITTGGSILQAYNAVLELGCEVTIIIALVERHESGGKALRDLDVPVLALFSTDEEGKLRDEFVAHVVPAGTGAR